MPLVPVAEEGEAGDVPTERVVAPRAGDHGGVGRRKRRDHHREAHRRRTPRAHAPLHEIRRDRGRVGHAGQAEAPEIGGVGEEVEHGDDAQPPGERVHRAPPAVAQLGRDVGGLAPAAEGEEDEDHRQGDPATSSRRRHARRGGGEDETGDDDRHQATDLERGERVLQPAALPQARDVDQREPDDDAGGHDGRDVRARLTVAQQRRDVIAHQERQQRDRAGLDHRHPRPGAEKAGAPTEGTAQEMVLAPGIGIGRRELGVAERAEQGHHPTDDPEREEHRSRGAAARHQLRGAEDARAEHQPHHEHDPIPGVQHGPRRGSSVGAHFLVCHVGSCRLASMAGRK